ncbi:ER membrane protein complex subunit 10-like [Gigantopelta aegis]|uniref:ER membrane protein complex subunit 10-like n=1 Tax=Gigantopelta aegis TaxID=1735272 RepID=UPI001B88883E|nr:ER membrane protein complex subunit 10-like [Gigantopelta aegis]
MAAPSENTVVGLVLIIICIFCEITATDDEFEGSRALTVEHSLDADSHSSYTKRGTIFVQSLKGNKAKFTQNSGLSSDQKKELKDLASSDGLYRIRVAVRDSDKQTPDKNYVSTFTKACYIYESALNDQLTVNFDPAGEILGISISTSANSCVGAEVTSANLSNWKTMVEVFQTVSGPTPDTQSYIDKLKREDAEKTKGQQGDNRSFFGKYWMYIVPFVIIMMVMSSAEPQAQGGGGR